MSKIQDIKRQIEEEKNRLSNELMQKINFINPQTLTVFFNDDITKVTLNIRLLSQKGEGLLIKNIYSFIYDMKEKEDPTTFESSSHEIHLDSDKEFCGIKSVKSSFSFNLIQQIFSIIVAFLNDYHKTEEVEEVEEKESSENPAPISETK